MPFDATRSNPVVADLLKVRAYIAEHGFSPELGFPGCARCFMGAASSVVSWDRYETVLPHIGAALESYTGDDLHLGGRGVFGDSYLLRHAIDTPKAIEIIDAAIARAYA